MLIKRRRLCELTGIGSEERLQGEHAARVANRLVESAQARESRWTGSVAVGSRVFAEEVRSRLRDLDVADQIEQGLRWIERIVAESGGNCASTSTLPEWLRERRADLVTEDQIARWQRVVDLLVVRGDSRVADLAD